MQGNSPRISTPIFTFNDEFIHIILIFIIKKKNYTPFKNYKNQNMNSLSKVKIGAIMFGESP